ncbi:MAG: hypothetical protein ABWY64_27270, partial [Tardiphaga sp.]
MHTVKIGDTHFQVLRKFARKGGFSRAAVADDYYTRSKHHRQTVSRRHPMRGDDLVGGAAGDFGHVVE